MFPFRCPINSSNFIHHLVVPFPWVICQPIPPPILSASFRVAQLAAAMAILRPTHSH
jgi:hypothetical protein